MAREETLRALITARETVAKSMRSAAEGTRELRDSMAETMASSSSLAGTLDATEAQTDQYSRTVAGLGRDSVETAAELELLRSAIGDASTEALEGAAAMEAYEIFVDEAGDEARETAVENMGLAASFQAVAAAAGEASVNVGPFNTSVKRAVVALPLLIALVGSASTAFLGVAAAATAATGALGALFAGGLVGQAEALAASSADIENRMEALEEIFTRVGSAIDEVTEPIQGLEEQQAAMSLLNGMVTIIGDLARSADRLSEAFAPVADRLGAVFWREEARGIAEVEKMIAELLPLLEDLTFYILTNLPDLFAWLREETERVGPAFGDFVTSAIPVIRALTEIGNTILRFTLPALSLILDGLTALLDVLNDTPDALLTAAFAFGVSAAFMAAYAGSATGAAVATTALTTAVYGLATAIWGALLAPLTPAIVAVAAVVAAVAGAITYFDAWGDILNGLIAIWNGLVEVVEAGVNLFLALYDHLSMIAAVVAMVNPALGALLFLIANIGKVLGAIGDIIGWVFGKLRGLVEWAIKWIDRLLGGLADLSNKIDETGGDVQLDAAKVERPSASSEGGPSRKGGQGQGQGESRSDQLSGRAAEIQGNRPDVNVDMRNSEFGTGTTKRDVEIAVERALERQREKSGDL